MDNYLQKIEKIKTVVKVRERELNFSRTELVKTQKDKASMLNKLTNSQKSYMKAVDDLNKIRMCNNSDQQSLAIETSIDYVRNTWAEQLTEVRRLEKQERIQLVMIKDLEAKLKATEIIMNKYESEYKESISRKEQNHLDDFVNHRYAK